MFYDLMFGGGLDIWDVESTRTFWPTVSRKENVSQPPPAFFFSPRSLVKMNQFGRRIPPTEINTYRYQHLPCLIPGVYLPFSKLSNILGPKMAFQPLVLEGFFCRGMHHSFCWCERWSKMWSSRPSGCYDNSGTVWFFCSRNIPGGNKICGIYKEIGETRVK